LPAALVQGQRDFFGAHTYKRIDVDGVFHTLWSGDRSEIETEPSTH
jgi:6-phosphogluconate dehydrogenase